MTDRPYTVAGLAERWGCSREHVYQLIRIGQLQVFRLGGKLLRVSASEVARWESAGGSTALETTPSSSSTGRPAPSGARMDGAAGSLGRADGDRRSGARRRTCLHRRLPLPAL